MRRPLVLGVVPETLRAQFFDAALLQRLERTAAHSAAAATGCTLIESLTAVPADLDLSSVEVLITSWGLGPLDAATLERLPSLGLVAHTGASVKFLPPTECFARGIRITQAGAAMARPVAEVALAFTLALLHQLQRFDHSLHSGGAWAEAAAARTQHEIFDATIGVVGASRTGLAYVDMVRALGARVLLYDPTLSPEEACAAGCESVPLEELLRRSRIVALHAPSLPETYRMISAEQLAVMPDGAGLVNTARSWLVDEAALLAELGAGRLDAALDVFDEEPLPTTSAFRSLPNVLLVPHQAAGTREGRLRQGEIVVEEIEAFRAGMPLRHEVTATDLARMA